MSARRRLKRFGATAALTLGVLAASSAAAGAGVLVASASSCDDQPLAKTFLPWLDLADYTPLSGGDFEPGVTAWSMSGGAATAAGNSSFQVGGSSDANSLSLPAGASATSPAICVGVQHPTIRFFAKRRSGGLLSLSTLRVDVLFEDAAGSMHVLPIGIVANSGSWQPTLPIVAVANLLTLLPGDATPVAFRFTAQGAAWSVDDVWVDPYLRH